MAAGEAPVQPLDVAEKASEQGHRPGLHWKGEEVPPSPPPSRAPSLCPATVPPTPSAGLNGIRNRQ